MDDIVKAEEKWLTIYDPVFNFEEIYEGWFESDTEAFFEIFGEIYNLDTHERLIDQDMDEINELYDEWITYAYALSTKILTPDTIVGNVTIKYESFYLYRIDDVIWND